MEEDTSFSLLGLQYEQKHLGTPGHQLSTSEEREKN